MDNSIFDSWLLPLLAAPFVGSFLGVLIVRLPVAAPVVLSRSECPHCHERLDALDLLPLLGFVLLKGRCRRCGHPIGWFHPAIELAAVAVALWSALAVPDPSMVWVACGLGWALLTLSWIDWDAFLLPDALTLPLIVAGLGATMAWSPEMLTDHSLAAIVGYLAFQGLASAYRRLRGMDGLGGGDSKLLAAAGAWCGLEALPFIVLGSAVMGLLAALGLALSGRGMTSRTPIPFGPCIALAFWLAWLHPGAWVDLMEILGG